MGSKAHIGRLAGAVAMAIALAIPAKAEFRVVGYLPAWTNITNNIQYSKLTHILYSFAKPGDNGSLTGFDGAKLSQLVAKAHANKVKVFLALGGGGNHDDGFNVCTASETCRAAMAKACMDAVHQYSLDGIDFDWEYPDGAQVAGYNAIVKLLAARLHAEKKEISAAVTYNDWPKSFPTRELYDGVAPGFDFLNIMIYDNPPPHATVQHCLTSLDIWIKNKGLPKEKFILGAPFYGPGGRYNDIVAGNPAAAWVDQNGAEGYNSIPTMRKKTDLALKQAGGIMFWEISQDATGELSLLSAVHDVIAKSTDISALNLDPATRRVSAGGFWNGRNGFGFRTPGAADMPILAVDAGGRLLR